MRLTVKLIVMALLLLWCLPGVAQAGTYPWCDEDEVGTCEGSGPGMPQHCYCRKLSPEEMCKRQCYIDDPQEPQLSACKDACDNAGKDWDWWPFW